MYFKSMISVNLLFIFISLTNFLYADIVVFQSGSKLENVKVKVRKDAAEIYYENGKMEIRRKTELKSIKLIPVSWTSKPKKEEKPKNSTKNNTKNNIAEELVKLEKERETNYAIPPTIIGERKRHDFLLKERIRLQYTEGYLLYAGGQILFTEIMVRNKNRFFVKNEYGLQHLNLKDFGEEIVIDTDKGTEKIPISKMLSVKEEKYRNGFIYLANGEKYKGMIESQVSDIVTLKTNRGKFNVAFSEILFPIISKKAEVKRDVLINEGEKGIFTFNNGQTIHGKLLKVSKNMLIIETVYGILEMDLENLVSATKEEFVK